MKKQIFVLLAFAAVLVSCHPGAIGTSDGKANRLMRRNDAACQPARRFLPQLKKA